MADGTPVAVAHTDPVPANVVADIQKRANAKWPSGPVTDNAATLEEQKLFNQWIAQVSQSTGGRTVFVLVEAQKLNPPVPGVMQAVTNPWQVVQNTARNVTQYKSFDAALAGAQAAAASVGPSVIVTLGR